MKTFSITKLEIARKDPKSFAKQLIHPATPSERFWGQAKFTRWQNAIGEFHKKEDINKAIIYLHNSSHI